jgi:hypothetical protein
MTPTRRFWALPALALILVLGACSTPDDLNAPMLEPQFGTADEDRGIDVAFVSTGRIYLLSEQIGPKYLYYEDGSSYENGSYSKVFLKRQDSSGNVTWTKEIKSGECGYNDYWDEYDCTNVKPISVVADTQGNISVLTSSHEYYYGQDIDYEEWFHYRVTKYNASGNYLSEVSFYDYIGTSSPISFTVDGSGNFYVARRDGDSFINSIAKYAPSGGLQWERTSTVGTVASITVSSSGSTYVVGNAGIARYSSSGTLNWTKPGNFEEVMVSGSNLYTRYRTNIFKYDGNGNQLWKRTQSGLTTPSFADMKGDGSGNVYLAGKYNASSTNRNAFIRKLNSSGSVLWTKTYGTSAYDDALGIATINGSEIYTTGSTQGSLAHTNIGGSDAYLRKVNSSGNLLWTR